jgi:hypothetical protein
MVDQRRLSGAGLTLEYEEAHSGLADRQQLAYQAKFFTSADNHHRSCLFLDAVEQFAPC